MSETLSHTSVPEPVLAPGAFELKVPRNAQGERIGTGAIVEPLRPGLPGETVRGAILKAIFRAGRSMQAPRGVVERSGNRTGQSFVTEQERAIAAARKQEVQTPQLVQRQPDSETSQLLQADRQQTERKLAATRSALGSMTVEAPTELAQPQQQDKNEEAKQPADKKEKKPQQETELIHFYDRRDGSLIASLQLPKNYTAGDVNRAARANGVMKGYTYYSESTPQPLDKSEAGKKPAESKAKKEPETEPVKFYHARDGHLLFTLQLPKGGKYTTADVNRAARAAGVNYTYSPAWTPGGWRMRGRDVLAALKKTVQAAAPPEAQQPGQKVA